MTLSVALPRKSTVQIRFSRQSETAIAENSWDYLKVALVDSFTQHSSECVSWALEAVLSCTLAKIFMANNDKILIIFRCGAVDVKMGERP